MRPLTLIAVRIASLCLPLASPGMFVGDITTGMRILLVLLLPITRHPMRANQNLLRSLDGDRELSGSLLLFNFPIFIETASGGRQGYSISNSTHVFCMFQELSYSNAEEYLR